MFYDKKELEKAHKKVRENVTPQQRSFLKAADEAFNEGVESFDARLDVENKLRVWARDLLGRSASISEIEELRDVIRSSPNSKLIKFNGSEIYKTAFGNVDKVDRYILTLEKTIIDITNSSQFTNLGFFGLIKLAFKKLFKRLFRRSN